MPGTCYDAFTTLRYDGLKEPFVIFLCNDMVALTTIYQIDAVLNIVLEYNVFFSKLKIKMIHGYMHRCCN
ncbi:MAG: hypothetical protein ACTHKF_09395 [Candidatus Nitrosocosmicus sp.]